MTSPGTEPEDPDELFVYRVKAALRRERLKQGLSFRELQRRCGISHGYLAYAERSDVQPTLLVIHRWAKGLGIKLEAVIRNSQPKT